MVVLLCGCWKSNLSPLIEQLVLLATEPLSSPTKDSIVMKLNYKVLKLRSLDLTFFFNGMYMNVQVWRSDINIGCLSIAVHLSSETGSHWNWSLPIVSTGWPPSPSGIWLSPLPHCWGYWCATLPCFLVAPGNLNLHPLACIASTFPLNIFLKGFTCRDFECSVDNSKILIHFPCFLMGYV